MSGQDREWQRAGGLPDFLERGEDANPPAAPALVRGEPVWLSFSVSPCLRVKYSAAGLVEAS